MDAIDVEMVAHTVGAQYKKYFSHCYNFLFI
jgi:hypothetical protein